MSGPERPPTICQIPCWTPGTAFCGVLVTEVTKTGKEMNERGRGRGLWQEQTGDSLPETVCFISRSTTGQDAVRVRLPLLHALNTLRKPPHNSKTRVSLRWGAGD